MKKIVLAITLIAMAVLVLTACAPAPTPTPVPPTPAPKPTDPPKPTVAPPPTAPPPTVAATKPPEPTKPSIRTKANPGEKITLYHLGDVTGPLAAITTPLVSGFDDGVKYLNKTGGIRGAEVLLEMSDTKSQVDLAILGYNRFREKKPLILQMYGSPETEALKARLGEDKIPVLTAGVSSKGSYPPGYVFAVVPIYTDQFGLFLDWLVPNWDKVKPAKGQALDSPKIAFITWDTAFGRDVLTAEARAYAEKKGVKIVGQELFTPGAPDVTTQILNAKKAGANVIYTNTLAHGPAQILKDAVALGVRDEFMIAGCNWGLDLSMLGLAREAAEGFYGVFPNLWWDDVDHPGVKIVQAEFTANNRKPAERAVGYLLAFSFVEAMKQYIEKTIDRVGFEGLTGAAVYDTIISTGRLDAMQGVTTLDFGPDKRAPSRARIVQVQKGKFVYLTNWMIAPDLRPK